MSICGSFAAFPDPLFISIKCDIIINSILAIIYLNKQVLNKQVLKPD